jgi:hypothetical protein
MAQRARSEDWLRPSELSRRKRIPGLPPTAATECEFGLVSKDQSLPELDPDRSGEERPQHHGGNSTHQAVPAAARDPTAAL